MTKLRTASAVVGILAGLWAIGGTVEDEVARSASGSPNLFVLGLGGLLTLTSVVCLFGPSVLYYASAALSVFLEASMSLNSNFSDWVVDVAAVLAAVAFVLAVLAARSRTDVSEQSNPMNLPVFG
jgi:hypothetical protein